MNYYSTLDNKIVVWWKIIDSFNLLWYKEKYRNLIYPKKKNPPLYFSSRRSSWKREAKINWFSFCFVHRIKQSRIGTNTVSNWINEPFSNTMPVLNNGFIFIEPFCRVWRKRDEFIVAPTKNHRSVVIGGFFISVKNTSNHRNAIKNVHVIHDCGNSSGPGVFVLSTHTVVGVRTRRPLSWSVHQTKWIRRTDVSAQ